MKISVSIIFLFCTASLQCFSQEYNYYHYDIKDGLSGITVYSVAQDKDGFLWFGTETGLSRFDGTHFKNYTESEGLNENEIISLFVDSKNRVWIFPFKNSVYYYYHGKIYNNSNDSLLKKFHLKNEIFKACEDKSGNVFFLESDRVHILSADNKLTEIAKFNGNFFFNNGCGLSGEGNCDLFISYSEDISNSRIRIYEYEDSQFFSKKILRDYNLSRNTLEVNPNYMVFRNLDFFEIYDRENNKKFKVKVPEHLHTLSYIDDSCFIISTLDKTFLFNINQKKIVDSFLINKTVNKCFKDNENNLWFATTSYGVYRLSSTKVTIYKFENNFNTMPVYALNEANSNLYVSGTKNFLWNLNLQNNKLEKLKLKTDYDIGRISSIQILNKQNLLLGTDNGIFKISKSTILNYFPRISIKSLLFYNDSVIVASDRNVLNMPLKNFNYVDTIWRGRATCAYKINDQYYIGTLSSFYIVKNDSKHSVINLGSKFPLLKEKIIGVTSTSDGNLWVATESHGLICMKNDEIICQLTTKNGLTSNLCRCLYASKNNLWLGTNKGICKIDISYYPFHIIHFTAAEGLDCEIINCIYVTGDSVFAGTPFGLTSFNTNKIQNTSICELKLVDIQSKNDNWFYKQDSVHLLSNDNFVRFEYAAISFVSLGDITYYYQLKGLDNSWQSTKQNSVEFESLPAGDYQFSIYALNKYGIKSKTLIVSFTKEKTFWQSPWVQGALIIFVTFLIWLILRAWIKSIRKKANEKIISERKIYELEQMALRAQMNPHFIFNSLNSIQQYVFAGDVIEANQFITNFSLLIRETFYISGKKFITLAEEIKYLKAYLTLEQCKYENIFDFQIMLSGEAALENIVIPPLLLQPFIENSIRHGILNIKDGKGKIFIQFLVANDTIECIIVDNGVGREKAIKLRSANSQHQSKGMELVQKRIENLNTIYNVKIIVLIEDIQENKETGTRVRIKLPLSYAE